MLYVILQGLTMIVQASTTGDSTVWGVLDSVYKYNIEQLQGSNLVSSFWVPAQVAVAVLMSMVDIVLLYYPALFSGSYLWIWFCICLPVAVGFVVSIVTLIRGVAST
jgi:hypothetical protein